MKAVVGSKDQELLACGILTIMPRPDNEPAQARTLRRLEDNQLGRVGSVDGDMSLSCNTVSVGVGIFT